MYWDCQYQTSSLRAERRAGNRGFCNVNPTYVPAAAVPPQRERHRKHNSPVTIRPFAEDGELALLRQNDNATMSGRPAIGWSFMLDSRQASAVFARCRPDRGPRHGARLCRRTFRAERDRLGRGQAFSGRRNAQGRSARHGRHLHRRGRRRLRPVAADRDLDLRGAGDRLPDGRGLYVDPQHDGVADRRLRHGRAAARAGCRNCARWSCWRATA